MTLRGVRGATVAEADTPEAILSATRELLLSIQGANPSLKAEEIASALFTVTGDLASAYPAKAARQMGWTQVPLMCALEIPVPGGMARCIRVLLHWNTELPQGDIQHVYLRDAAQLRPDIQFTGITGGAG